MVLVLDTIRRLKEALPPFNALSDLKRKTATESAGPCPLCGGTDRFYVRDGKAFCRQCWPKGGDIIDWHCRIDGMDLADFFKSVASQEVTASRSWSRHTITRMRPEMSFSKSVGWSRRAFDSGGRTERAVGFGACKASHPFYTDCRKSLKPRRF